MRTGRRSGENPQPHTHRSRRRGRAAPLLEAMEGRLLMAATLPTVSILSPVTQLLETRAGAAAGTATLRVTRTGPLDQPLTVNLALAGTAAAGTQFRLVGPDGTTELAAGANTVTIPAGQRTVTLRLSVLEDGTANPTRQVQVSVSPDPDAQNPSYTPAAQSLALVTIMDSQPTVTITPIGAISEGGTNQRTFLITRTAAPGGTLAGLTTAVNLAFTGTFSAANITGPSSVTLGPGVSRSVVTLTTASNNLANGTQTIIGTISGTGFTTGGTGAATVNVTDASPTLHITAVTATTVEGSNAPGQFLITRTGSTTNNVTVNFTVGTAAANGVRGTDYVLTDAAGNVILGNTLTIPAGRQGVAVFVRSFDNGRNAALTVPLTIAAGGTAYNLGTPTSATVTVTNLARLPVVRRTTAPKLATLNGSFTLTFDDLVTLMGAGLATGSNGTLQVRVSAVTFGTLQRIPNGSTTAATAGANTVFSAGDRLVWTAPANTKANRAQAFTLVAVDGTGVSTTVTSVVVTIL